MQSTKYVIMDFVGKKRLFVEVFESFDCVVEKCDNCVRQLALPVFFNRATGRKVTQFSPAAATAEFPRRLPLLGCGTAARLRLSMQFANATGFH